MSNGKASVTSDSIRSIVNVVPACLMATIHISGSTSLLPRLPLNLPKKDAMMPFNAFSDVEYLQKLPLLISINAETLPRYLQGYVRRCSPHSEVRLGRWILPRNQISVVST